MKRPDKMTTNFESVLAYIESAWWMSDWGFIRKRSGKVELHTGGWSDNEVLVQWIKTTMFWMMCWEMTRAGGHYYFQMPKHREVLKDAKS